ncbi:MAG TPA: glycosyltransferase family 1 protein [Chitinophagaceae bacterium]|nr:glycosyltransferase family 1 protein [Chitinophagaceae bacterium]
MKKYLVDLHRLRHNPYNGLYSFSVQLATHLLNNISSDENLYYYLPKNKFGYFGNKPNYLEHKRYHKFFQTGTSKYDLWHLTTGISQYRPFNKRTKVVYTIHDMNFLVEGPGNSKRNNRSLSLMQKNADRADHIVSISNFALAQAKQYLEIDNKPCSVIYNGYTVNEFEEFDDPVYRPSGSFLFSLSLVQPRKNFHVLPALLVNNNFELIIAGLNHFDYARKIVEEANRLGVGQRVKLIGAIDEKNKYWYYRHCHAFMFPSIAEGFGAPPLEAMHFGKPVFLSKFMSLPEIGGSAAYYFDDFSPEAMRSVFENGMNDYRNNNRQKQIKQQAALFNWDAAAKKYLDIYRGLVA